MSDEESDSEQSENAEDDSEAPSSDDGEADAEKRAAAARDDIALIKDILQHVNQTSKRISATLDLQQRLEEAQVQLKDQQYTARSRPASGGPAGWDNYEELSEPERAELLERALIALSQDQL